MTISWYGMDYFQSSIKQEVKSLQDKMQNHNDVLAVLGTMERFCADYCGVTHAVLTDDYSTTVDAILSHVGVMSGDAVIVPSHFLLSSVRFKIVEMLLENGIEVLYASCHPATYQMGLDEILKVMTGRVRAVIADHHYGIISDMDAIMTWAERQGVFVLEDGYDAAGGLYKDRRVGGIGHASIVRFDYTDIVFCLSGEDDIARAIRYAFKEKQIDSAVLSQIYVSMQRQDNWNTHRYKLAQHYMTLEAVVGLVIPQWYDRTYPSWSFFPLRVEEGRRDALISHLASCKVEVSQSYMSDHVYHEQVIEVLTNNVFNQMLADIVMLPIHPFIGEKEIKEIRSHIEVFFQ